MYSYPLTKEHFDIFIKVFILILVNIFQNNNIFLKQFWWVRKLTDDEYLFWDTSKD